MQFCVVLVAHGRSVRSPLVLLAYLLLPSLPLLCLLLLPLLLLLTFMCLLLPLPLGALCLLPRRGRRTSPPSTLFLLCRSRPPVGALWLAFLLRRRLAVTVVAVHNLQR